MNRRALLKGLGRAVAGLALLPLVSLLPKASPIVHASGGIPIRKGWHGFTLYQGRLFALNYDDPQTVFSWSEMQDIKRWGEMVGKQIEEEVSKIS